MIVNLKDYSKLKNWIQFADLSYRKQKAIVVIADSVSLFGTYWDGGSRNSYTFINMDTRTLKFGEQYAPAQFGGPKETPEIVLNPGTICVSTGVFCGKKATATVYLNIADKDQLGLSNSI